MNILSIDTTTKVAGVSLQYNSDIIEKSLSNEITHSEKLLPLIDESLKEKNISLKDIDMYACINGPGSFTGIRIGLSTLKAFSFVDNKNIFSMSSCDLLTYCAYTKTKCSNEKYTIISLIDARNDRVYYTVNELNTNDNNKIEITNKVNSSNENISTLISSLNEDYANLIFIGDCVNNYTNVIKEKYPNAILINYYPTPTDLINAFYNVSNVDKYTFNSYSLDANYVRPSQAERIMKNE